MTRQRAILLSRQPRLVAYLETVRTRRAVDELAFHKRLYDTAINFSALQIGTVGHDYPRRRELTQKKDGPIALDAHHRS